MKQNMSKFFTFALALAMVFSFLPIQRAEAGANLLTNPGFETGAVSPVWNGAQNGGSIAINSTAAYVHSGTYSAKITTSSSSTGASGSGGGGACSGGKRTAISPNTAYYFSGWVFVPTTTTSNFTSARLRVAFYANCTGGSQISTADSTIVTTASGAWTFLEGVAGSPATANFVEVRLYGQTSPATAATIYFDDLALTTFSGTTVLNSGTVNGDGSSGITHNAAYNNQLVTVKGILYEKTLQATSGTSTYKGFFIEDSAATSDGDPNTSDGLFIYNGTSDTLVQVAGGLYTPTVGDEVEVSGVITEYYNYTEMVNPVLVAVADTGLNIDTEVPAVVANPPVPLIDANAYWEKLQNMRVQAPINSIVLGGRNVFSPADAEIWLARSDSTIAGRVDPYTRRAFRDAHPLDDNYNPTVWDGNGYRILIGSQGIKAVAGNAQALLDPARTFDTLTNAPSGGLNYTYSKYRIEVTTQPTFSEGVDPALNNPPTAIADRNVAYNIVDYNLENLYDYRNNPFSNCDFGTDSGCNKVAPFLDSVYSPFNYVPASLADYQARLVDIATQIIDDLHVPDILMVQEVENQDICSVVSGAMVCDTNFGNPDGRPDVLEDLALEITAIGGPTYDSAYDKDSSDLRGILPAYLYRTDRVQLAPYTGDPVLDANPNISGYTAVSYDSDKSNPKALNAVYTGTGACETSYIFPRALSVGLFRVYSESIGVGSYRDIYLINNHFKSGPDSCVAHRTEQANYNAALVGLIQKGNAYARIIVGGDLNVYPHPDNTAYGAADQLGALYDSKLGLKNLWEVLLAKAPEAAYSYVYLGMAQTLDQMFVNQLMLTDLQEFRIAHINSDFPADYPDDVARGTSDHDPNVATFGITFTGFLPPIANPPTINLVTAGSVIPVKFSLGGNKGLNIFATGYPQSSQIECVAGTLQDDTKLTVNPGKNSLSYDPLTDQYTYLWKTDRNWAGTCRQLIFMLNDGTVQIANFQFYKP